MAFKIGAFARGFATAAVEEKKEKENEIKELVKASYLDSLQEARELRKDRKAKRERLKELGSQLKLFGFSPSQSAGLLSMGEEGAKELLALANTAKINNENFDVAAFYQVAEDSDLTMEDAINRTMGELKKPTEKQLPGFASQSTFLGGDMSGFTEKQFGQYEKSFGESYQQLRAEADGEYTYADTPKGDIDYKMLKLDETEEDKLRLKIAQAQLAKAEKELEDADKKGLTIGQQSQSGAYIKGSVGEEIARRLGEGITYTAERGYVGPEGQQELVAKAENILAQVTSRSIDYMNAQGIDTPNVLNGAVVHALEVTIPQMFESPSSSDIEPLPEEETETIVAEPANEAEISAFLDQQFSDPSYANIANTGEKKAKRARIKAEAVNKLMAGGMSPKDANDLILKLTKGK